MRLTKQANYAVRSLMYCAANEPNLSRVGDIAQAYGISEAFLFKLIKPLVDHGLLKTVRGRNGGIRLGRPADQISLKQAISLSEDSFALAECFEKVEINCPLVGVCDFNMALQNALDGFFKVLDRYTIADLVEHRVVLREKLAIAN